MMGVGEKYGFNNNHSVLFAIDRDGAAGVYQLWLNNECMYVGQTQNIFRRMVNHWQRNFDSIVFIPVVHWAERLNLEFRLIQSLNPRWNVSLVNGRLSEDRRCKPGGARGRDLSGDRYANNRLLLNIAIDKAGTQKKLSEIFGVTPKRVSYWRRTGVIPHANRDRIEQYIGMSVDTIASFLSDNAGSDPWKNREYFKGEPPEEEAA